MLPGQADPWRLTGQLSSLIYEFQARHNCSLQPPNSQISTQDRYHSLVSHGGYFLCVEEKTTLELVSLKGVVPRAGDTAQQSRALFALAEDPRLVPSIHI